MENIKTEPDVTGGIDRKIVNQPKDHIPGWGIDADPENDPTYPMKHRNGADYERLNYEKPPQQPVNMEILRSTERPVITRVFGTSVPPSGLSGVIRRAAYKYSENKAAHWLGLILADRVNTFEGLLDDIKEGTFPNIIKERGWTAEWKYNREGVIKAAVAGVLITTVALALLRSKRK